MVGCHARKSERGPAAATLRTNLERFEQQGAVPAPPLGVRVGRRGGGGGKHDNAGFAQQWRRAGKAG